MFPKSCMCTTARQQHPELSETYVVAVLVFAVVTLVTSVVPDPLGAPLG